MIRLKGLQANLLENRFAVLTDFLIYVTVRAMFWIRIQKSDVALQRVGSQ